MIMYVVEMRECQNFSYMTTCILKQIYQNVTSPQAKGYPITFSDPLQNSNYKGEID